MTPCATAASTTAAWAFMCPLACVRACSRPRASACPSTWKSWPSAEEEGQRYKATFWARAHSTGDFKPAWLDQTDADGISMRDAMQHGRVGRGHTVRSSRNPCRLPGLCRSPYRAGPGAQRAATFRWAWSPPSTPACAMSGEMTGMASHAGTTPMDQRRDAAAAVAELILYVEQRATPDGDSVGTVGMLQVPNGSINVVPGRCQFSLDLRAPSRCAARCTGADVLCRAAQRICRRAVACTTASTETMRASAAPSAPAWQAALGSRSAPHWACPCTACPAAPGTTP